MVRVADFRVTKERNAIWDRPLMLSAPKNVLSRHRRLPTRAKSPLRDMSEETAGNVYDQEYGASGARSSRTPCRYVATSNLKRGPTPSLAAATVMVHPLS